MKGKYAKSKFIQNLEEMPFISYAAKQAGVARSTIYRWTDSDYEFRRAVDRAMSLSRTRLVDIAELALVKRIKEGHLGAIIFYLQHNDKRYLPKRPVYLTPQQRHLKPGETCEFCEQTKLPEMSREKMIEKMKQEIRDQEALEEQYKEAGYDLDATLKAGKLVRLPGRDNPDDVSLAK